MTLKLKPIAGIYLMAIAIIGVFVLLPTSKSFAQTFCHSAVSNETFPVTDAFGVPWDVFSSGQEAIIQIICGSPLSTARIGNGKINQYIFEEAYAYQDNQWQRETLSGEKKIANWFVSNATTNLSVSRAQLSQPNFFVAYICTYVNGAWQCGCKAANDCTENRWNLQVFSGQPSELSLPEMTFTQSISSIKPGGSVTVTWTASNATRCFGWGDNSWPGEKAFNGQQTITNIQKDERYHLQCDGPGGSRMLLIQVWMLPEGVDGFAPVQ